MIVVGLNSGGERIDRTHLDYTTRAHPSER